MAGISEMQMEFASPEWLDFFRKLLIARAAIMDTPAGVTCEVYRDVPRHLSPDGKLAWTRRVQGRTAEVEFVECPDVEADVKLRGDYAALLPLSRHVVGEDGAAFEAMIADAVERGGIEIVKNERDPDAPRDFTVHDIMAVLTR